MLASDSPVSALVPVQGSYGFVGDTVAESHSIAPRFETRMVGDASPRAQLDRRNATNTRKNLSQRKRHFPRTGSGGRVIIPALRARSLANEDMISGRPVAELFDLVNSPDKWRSENPFSPEMEDCQATLFEAKYSRAEKADALNKWLASTNYPCLFGRMAAKRKEISILILEERDLWRSDQEIEDLLRIARLQWKREALEWKKQAFVLLAASRRLAFSRPDEGLLRLTIRLCELFLRRRIEANHVYRDEMQMELSQDKRISWRAGVDNFSAQGDGQWWHDHRIPGGVGFVVNSVGHMARSLVEKAIASDRKLRDKVAQMSEEKLTEWALPLAMRTILTAEKKSRIPGTRLSPNKFEHKIPLAADLSGYSCDSYHGWYHTDETIRGEFFGEGPERPAHIETELQLDFTYLHKRDEEDYACMSLGEEILEVLGVKDDSDTD